MALQLQFLKNLVDRVVEQGLEDIVDSMIAIDPRLVCRLNLRNKSVGKVIKKKMDQGLIHPFDLMYDAEETLALEPVLTSEIKTKIESMEEENQGQDYFVDLYSSSGEWTIDFEQFDTAVKEWDPSASDIGECLV